MSIAVIFILAVTVEALIEYGKLIFQKEINWKQIAAIVVAVLLAVAAGTDLYEILGVAFNIPYIGMVLTGILFSRGANYLADFIKLTQTSSNTMRALGDSERADIEEDAA